MKKYLPYLLIGLIVAAVIVLFWSGQGAEGRELDERLSFRKRDKIPYGLYAAYENLPYLFPNASVSASRDEPGMWDSLSTFDNRQALLIVSPRFNADEYEMRKLIQFAENGNDVFISTMKVSFPVEKLLKCDIYYAAGESELSLMSKLTNDTLTVSLDQPLVPKKTAYSYPGKRIDSWFYKYDTSTSTVLGYDRSGNPNFIRLGVGKGNLYLQLAPMTFTNYFLLHKNNLAYYEQALSVLSPGVKKVVWDEYYLGKKEREETESNTNWLSAFLKNKPLRWALLTALFTLLLYVLMEMRRKQRYIPVVAKPRNDSLDFVKTIGRLYYDKGDHKNLARKMSAYFLEHIRNRYKLPTTELNDELVQQVHFKTGLDETEIKQIVYFIRELEQQPAVSDKMLSHFHKQLESFYKKA